MKTVTINTGSEGRNGAHQIMVNNTGAELATDETPVEIRFWLRVHHMSGERIEFNFHAGVAAALAENFIPFQVSAGRITIETAGQFRAELWA